MKITLALLSAAALFAQSLGVTTGNKTVTTAGTAVRIVSNNTPFKSGQIQNTSASATICFGGSNVSVSSKIGTCLDPKQAGPLLVVQGFPFDLSNFYADSSADGGTLSYTIYQQQ